MVDPNSITLGSEGAMSAQGASKSLFSFNSARLKLKILGRDLSVETIGLNEAVAATLGIEFWRRRRRYIRIEPHGHGPV